MKQDDDDIQDYVRPWRGLTDEDKDFIVKRASVYDWHDYEVIEATEAKLKEKNTGHKMKSLRWLNRLVFLAQLESILH